MPIEALIDITKNYAAPTKHIIMPDIPMFLLYFDIDGVRFVRNEEDYLKSLSDREPSFLKKDGTWVRDC